MFRGLLPETPWWLFSVHIRNTSIRRSSGLLLRVLFQRRPRFVQGDDSAPRVHLDCPTLIGRCRELLPCPDPYLSNAPKRFLATWRVINTRCRQRHVRPSELLFQAGQHTSCLHHVAYRLNAGFVPRSIRADLRHHPACGIHAPSAP